MANTFLLEEIKISIGLDQSGHCVFQLHAVCMTYVGEELHAVCITYVGEGFRCLQVYECAYNNASL